MERNDKKLIDRFSNDFYRLADQEGWTKEDIENMKNLQKLMYYIEVRCAMQEGEDYQEPDYMDEMENERRSYNSRSYGGNDGYNASGRGSYARGGNGRSGRRSYNSYNSSYGSPFFGRRYYDGEKENSVNDLRQMISMEQDPEKRSVLENVMHILEK